MCLQVFHCDPSSHDTVSFRKCLKFVPGKKTAIGDKPASKRTDYALTWERLPYAVRHILTTQDADVQKKTVSMPFVFEYCR
jgi:hypothetical protein